MQFQYLDGKKSWAVNKRGQSLLASFWPERPQYNDYLGSFACVWFSPPFAEFLQNCGNALNEEETHIMFDGAPAHHNAEPPAHHNAEPPADHVHLRMLPPYSPFLNIVEQAISALKSAVKNISPPQIHLQM